MRILDLFCCEGGGADGYRRAFPHAVIVGVDIDPQPLYPFTFEQADALTSVSPRPIDAAAVYGKNDGRRIWTRTDGTELRAATLTEAREAMEMPWADWNGVREAIPPAYTAWIGHQLAATLGVAA